MVGILESSPTKRSEGFFVAFSRAVEHVYFYFFPTFAMGRWGRSRQRKAQIGDLYSILRQAGVPTIDCRS